MIKLFQKILSIVLALVVLATTSGFRIYTHDCDCCGTGEISLVEIDECCGDAHDLTPCNVAHQSAGTCCPDQASNVHDCEEAHCCVVDADFYKLQEVFEKSKVLKVNLAKIKNSPFSIIDTEPLVQKNNTVFLDISKESPPKIPIRDFVIFSHSLKIAC
jgi:hypothetical protein